MSNILYNLLVMPIQMVVEITYSIMSRFLGNKGLAIIAVSLVIQTLILPLYKRSDALQDEERDKQKSMEHWVTHIKKTFKGDEKFMMLQTYYRQQNYKTYYALKSSFSILLQIPFFIAAYQYLSHLQDIKGTSFMMIHDLGAPDRLLPAFGTHLNVLPIAMTLINIVSGIIYTKGMPRKSKIQVYGLAVVFLVLLYNSPSGLVMYWTMNNIFSLLKNIFMKVLKHPKEVFSVSMIVLGGALLWFIRRQGILSKLKIAAVLLLVLVCQIPMLISYMDKKNSKRKSKIKERLDNLQLDKGLFFWEALFLAILYGFLIPVSVISSSASEFVVDGQNPMKVVGSVFTIYLGIFVVWFSIFYFLMTSNVKKIFSVVLFGVLGLVVANYMVFGTHTGVMSAMLVFEEPMLFSRKEQLFNLGIIAALFLLLIVLAIKKTKLSKVMVQIVALCMVAMCVMNTRTVQAEMKEYERNQADLAGEGIFTLSKEGNNVIVFMIDRAISGYIPYMFEECPELQETFAGFTYYPNTLSFGMFTNFATPALFGGYEYTPTKINARADETLCEKQNEALRVMPAIFSENGYKVTVCDPPYAGYSWNADLSIYDEYEGVDAYITEGAYAHKKSQFTKASNSKQQESNFKYYSLMKTMPLICRTRMYQDGNYFTTTSNEDSDYVVSTPFINWYTALISLEEMTKIEDGNDNTFLMIQNSTTHEPIILQTPEFTPANGIDVEEEFNKQPVREIDGHVLVTDTQERLAHYEVNVATMKAIGVWIEYLKEMGVYDNTRIILVSDHGRGLHQFDYMMLENGEDVERFNPVLMVKDFGDREYKVSNEFMTNADVPTIAMNGLIDHPTNPFSGNPINSDEKFAHPQRITTSHLYSIKTNNGNVFDTSDGVWYDITDNIFDNSKWVEVPEEN